MRSRRLDSMPRPSDSETRWDQDSWTLKRDKDIQHPRQDKKTDALFPDFARHWQPQKHAKWFVTSLLYYILKLYYIYLLYIIAVQR